MPARTRNRSPRSWLRASALFVLLAVLLAVAGAQQNGLRDEARASLAQIAGEVRAPGLEQPVEILRDTWGVPHIYAQSQRDLFFAQGWAVAQDRLFQIEMWRRQAEGRLAEVLGPAAVERDRYARLLRFRGNWDEEWKSYSPDAREITEAFVRGINAYIAHVGDRLPVEFRILGFRPEPWTPEVCVSRLAGFPMTGNAGDELLRAEIVARLGAKRAALLFPTDPERSWDPAEGLGLEGVNGTALRGLALAGGGITLADGQGSNNWAVHGARTRSGKPILANDPHRALLSPSLRYIVHLVSPGWNVIGAGEPALPAVAIGHNERIAFGLTIFAAAQYADRGGWKRMEILEEEIRVKGEAAPRRVQLKFTKHGPVVYEDRERQRAYALRWVGTEPGTAGYFAGMALARAKNWQEFRRALVRWKLPPENFVYADVDGNIGYQAAGLAPIRENWLGILPVPGESGLYEWQGFYGLDTLPYEYNPRRRFVATANNNTLARGELRAIGFAWSSDHRVNRIRLALADASEHTVEDSQKLQTDYTSLAAQEFVPLLGSLGAENDKRVRAVKLLRDWETRLHKDSPSAAIYAAWMERLRDAVFKPQIPADLWPRARRMIGLPELLAALRDRKNPICDPSCQQRAPLEALDAALADLEARLGPEMNRWRWGTLRQAEFRHPLGNVAERAVVFNRGPVERGGDGTTLNAAGGAGFRQSSGASFRQIVDLADWDKSVASNVPGQSGQPESEYFDNLLPLWARDQYFPLLYSRAAVEKNTRHRLLLTP
jgi:penicillin amidase